MVDEGRLSEGHARALLGLLDPKEIVRLARDTIASGWSVREIERRVRGDRAPAGRPNRPTSARTATPAHRRVEDALRKRLGTDVRLNPRRRGRGFLTINYYSNDDLARLLELILGEPFQG